jgi:hypothetical protein
MISAVEHVLNGPSAAAPLTLATMDDAIAIGDRVRLVSTGEVGIVVWSWTSDVVGPECYVAFFGAEFPSCEPTDRPYLLRYAASSLQKFD